MALTDDGKVAQRVVRALQALSRGEADGVEIRGSSPDQEVAQGVVGAYLEGFELDVIFTELEDGFQVCVRNPASRIISIDL